MPSCRQRLSTEGTSDLTFCMASITAVFNLRMFREYGCKLKLTMPSVIVALFDKGYTFLGLLIEFSSSGEEDESTVRTGLESVCAPLTLRRNDAVPLVGLTTLT